MEALRTLGRWLAAALALLFSPIAEKNPNKLLARFSPIMLSGARLTVVVLTVVWCRAVLGTPQLLMSWPVATLGIALAFALRITDALALVRPERVVAFGERILDRFGVGAVGGRSPGYRPPADFRTDADRAERESDEP